MIGESTIAQHIWEMKYRLKRPDSAPVDKSIEETMRRVATALAKPENNPEEWTEHFYRVTSDFHFLPAGRILAGAGSDRKVTLFNCFVMGNVPEDMTGIFDSLKEAALTMQHGGGIGYDFSTLRPSARRRRRRIRTALLHGCLGRDVSNHHERRLAPRRHDGGVALRPSGYRSLHRCQA